MDASAALWLLLAVLSWWLGAVGAGARREAIRLERGAWSGEDYALVARIRRLHDDGVSLALRLRFSRVWAGVFVPLGLAAAAADLRWEWILLAIFMGWITAASAEAAGGGRLVRRLARLRGGLGYGAWARISEPGARLARPLLSLRAPPSPSGAHQTLVLAETQAALTRSGAELGRVERRFLRRLLASTSIVVADIMTRWESVRWIDGSADGDEAAAVIRESGHTRLPVRDGERVVGLLTAKNLLVHTRAVDTAPGSVRDLMRPVYFVRQEETMKRLLDELQEARVHLAVVVDRLGRHVGIVTMEDVLEEIVGELHDERERKPR
jgi:CBS domain-containing protein